MPNLTIAIAFGAGLLSFLSPCVLPLVPAYVGQLTAVAIVGRSTGSVSRWLTVRHALAYVIGFGVVFTVLGLTATYVGGALVDYLPVLRQIGGIALILLGLNLAGLLQDPGSRAQLATARRRSRGGSGDHDRHDVAGSRGS